MMKVDKVACAQAGVYNFPMFKCVTSSGLPENVIRYFKGYINLYRKCFYN